jgi:hypothetical protein
VNILNHDTHLIIFNNWFRSLKKNIAFLVSYRDQFVNAFRKIFAIYSENDTVLLNVKVGGTYCNVLGGFYSRWNFIALPKVNTLQLNTVSNSSNTRTRPTCPVSEHSLL